MKVLVEETQKEGLESLLGKDVTIFSLNYIYHGKLIGVNDTCIKLQNPSIVYETGKFSDSSFKDIQSLHTECFYVQTGCIESFGVLDGKR